MSDLTYRELCTSTDLTKRMEYVRRLKEDIATNERVLETMDRANEPADALKKMNKEMKDRLSDYDVYQQKPMYHCWRCKELDCVCELLE